MTNKQYQEQDRGDSNSYQQYIEAMDAISIEKVASASVFFSSKAGNTIVDVGMASGTSSAILANLFPKQRIIGVDINPKMVELAQQNYTKNNLSFRIDDGETLSGFEPASVDGFFNCSAIHHITSYNDYNVNRAYNTLARQAELLKDGGIIVVRDFVKPEIEEIFIELSDNSKKDRPSDADLLVEFSKTARSLSDKSLRGFPIEEITCSNKGYRKFKLYNTDAVEFIRRKDYYKNWDIELQEEYGYFTQREFEECFRSIGLRIILSSPIYNQWIINNRYKNQFKLFSLNNVEIGFPPTNYIIVGEKIKSSNHLSLTRYLPLQDSSFLRYSAYRNQSDNTVYEVVSRPNEVKDLIPYILKNDQLLVFAKKGYPRPIINAFKEEALDDKIFSGYITEGISISRNGDIRDTLTKYFGIEIDQSNITHLLNYYTSPGGIDENISSWEIKLDTSCGESIQIAHGYSGFSDSGSVQVYDAAQLLNTAQTGALVEARLELNIYQLFFNQSIPLPKWFGEKIILTDISEKQFLTNTWQDMSHKKLVNYIKTASQTEFLTRKRACFSEFGSAENSTQVLEFVHPTNLSINTLITLPIYKYKGEIYVGLEERSLPVPQIHTGNSLLFTPPAKRLDKSIKNLFDLNRFISKYTIFDSCIIDFFKLGEKYFPSIGITPEQVYPYVVTLDKPTEMLCWINLKELHTHRNEIKDAHLLICIGRLVHALL